MIRSAQDQRVKTALDETRLLILGAQILFGFHLNGAFQQKFSDLALHSRVLHALSFLMMMTAIALLIAPSLQHRLVERGQASERIIAESARFAAAALLPFALSLGVDLYIVIGYRFGTPAGIVVGTVFGLTAVAAWYGAEWLLRRPAPKRTSGSDEPHTPIDVRVEHMLTEARVLLPGAQALLGFQLAVMLTEAFGELPGASKLIHVGALCCTSLAVILLIAPAAFHRISFHGENTEAFHRLGSALVLAAAVPLGAGLIGDLYVSVEKGLDSAPIAGGIALAAFFILGALWLVHPLMLRKHRVGRA
jgi:hypothetical protein